MTLNLFLISESSIFFIDVHSFEQSIIGIFETNEKNTENAKDSQKSPRNVVIFSQGKSSKEFEKLKTTPLYKKISSKFPESKLIPIFSLNIDKGDSSEIKRIKKYLKQKFPEIKNFSKLKFVTILDEDKKNPNLQARDLKKSEQGPLKNKTGLKKKKKDSKTDNNLNIPEIPMRKKIEINAKDLVTKDITEQSIKNPEVKVILVECEICGRAITVPVPKLLIEKSNLPITEITYVHSEPPHALTAYLDKDFAVRRRRASNVIFQKKIETKKESK